MYYYRPILPLETADSMPKSADSMEKSACGYGPLELVIKTKLDILESQ